MAGLWEHVRADVSVAPRSAATNLRATKPELIDNRTFCHASIAVRVAALYKYRGGGRPSRNGDDGTGLVLFVAASFAPIGIRTDGDGRNPLLTIVNLGSA